MEYRDAMFQETLKDYALFEVKKAFIEFIKRDSSLPTPSDIIKLIEDDRKVRLIEQPSVAKLRQMQNAGIPLSPRQQAILNEKSTMD